MAYGQLSGFNTAVQHHLDKVADELEQHLNADVMSIVGPILYVSDDLVRAAVESRTARRQKLSVVLDTPGGIVEIVERIVRTLRQFYGEVIMVIPGRAMSAGTVLAMSGDAIMMDYYSAMGPIDPQVQNQSGNLVPAMSYLIQYERLIGKSRIGELTTAELALLQNLDLAELHSYEEARELSHALLEDWLAKYKFKNWNRTEGRGIEVTPEMRKQRAREIAEALSDYQRWHSHGRAISMDVLVNDLNLRIDDFSADSKLAERIKSYYQFIEDYMLKSDVYQFVHTIGFHQ